MKAFLSPGTRSPACIVLSFQADAKLRRQSPSWGAGVNTAEHSHAGELHHWASAPHHLLEPMQHLSGIQGYQLLSAELASLHGKRMFEMFKSRTKIYFFITQVELWFRFFPPKWFTKKLKKKKEIKKNQTMGESPKTAVLRMKLFRMKMLVSKKIQWIYV